MNASDDLRLLVELAVAFAENKRGHTFTYYDSQGKFRVIDLNEARAAALRVANSVDQIEKGAAS